MGLHPLQREGESTGLFNVVAVPGMRYPMSLGGIARLMVS